ELTDFVKQILEPGSEGPAAHLARLQAGGAGAEAFLTLRLEALGAAIQATAGEVSEREARFEAHLAEAASRSGATPEGLRDLVLASKEPGGPSMSAHPDFSALLAVQ